MVFKDNIARFINECRPWFPRNLPENINSLLATKNSFRLMSYNLLADSLLEHVDYSTL
jgi:hypothetical protein